MALKFRCPTCNELFSGQDDMAGAEMVCPICEARFEIPRALPRRKQQWKTHAPKPKVQTESQQRQAEKTPDAEEVQEDLGLQSPVSFRRRRPPQTDEMDMTPMVDVTFLLLIFFMVTAAFSLQKSYEMPAPDDSRPSTSALSLPELEADPQYVIVRIDEYDTFYIGAAAWDMEQEAPSQADLLEKLRSARTGAAQPPTHMLVMASEEATHGRVIMALDAGTAVGMEDVKLVTMP